MIHSLLDDDLYKFTTQQAILQHYPDAEVEYTLIFRTPIQFPELFIKEFEKQLDTLRGQLSLKMKKSILILRVSNERGWTRKERNFKTYPKIWENDLAIFVKLCDRIATAINYTYC